jgi:predicted thioesterase
MYLPLSAQADPRKATRAFVTAAERQGARVLTGHEVTAIRERGDGTYHVATSRGEVIAGTLVIAAGAWSATIGAMLGLDIPVVPVRGQMWATAAVPPTVFHTISSAESSLDWSRERAAEGEPPELTLRHGARVTRHLYGRQTRGGEIIFGGDRELVGYGTEPSSAGIEVNRAHAAEVIPCLRELPVARTWAGLMPFSMDGAPIIGRVPPRPNLYIVTGLASSGFGRGPMAGRLLAEYVHTGHRPPVLSEADPARCVTVREPGPPASGPPRDPAASPAFAGVRPGLRSEREFTVTERMVTRHVGGSGGVLTTPSMIGLMEDTAQLVTQPVLPADHTTVGFEVSVRHLAPTPVGGQVTVCAELLEVSGRKLLFRVEARHAGRTIGRGTHRRTIIQLGSLDPPSH